MRFIALDEQEIRWTACVDALDLDEPVGARKADDVPLLDHRVLHPSTATAEELLHLIHSSDGERIWRT